jgi:hypothetical protein
LDSKRSTMEQAAGNSSLDRRRKSSNAPGTNEETLF